MSTIKDVQIHGYMAFDACPIKNQNPEISLREFLATMNLPVFGIRITYGSKCDNQYGGKTALIEYRIEGQEAVATTWIGCLLNALCCAGDVIDVSVYDVENQEKLQIVGYL